MTWIIRKNSQPHQALQTMRLGAKSLTEIKRLINYRSPLEKFQASVMNTLTNAKLVVRRDERFHLTEKGEDLLVEYGAPRKVLRTTIVTGPSPLYDGLELRVSVQRPGADDHMKYPSRRGNRLYFRDGRVQDV